MLFWEVSSCRVQDARNGMRLRWVVGRRVGCLSTETIHGAFIPQGDCRIANPTHGHGLKIRATCLAGFADRPTDMFPNPATRIPATRIPNPATRIPLPDTNSVRLSNESTAFGSVEFLTPNPWEVFMKYLTFICAALIGLACQPDQARAGDEGWAAFGGFVGGYLVNEFTHHNHARKGNRHRSSSYSKASCPSPAYASPYGASHATVQPVVVQPVATYVVTPPPAPCGRWETRSERYWVPGQWATQNTACGPRQAWHEGHWATRNTRVWIQDTGYGTAPPPRGRHHNGYNP